MIDITGPKILIPMTLFALLNVRQGPCPMGICLAKPDIIHTSLFIPIYYIIARLLGLQLKPADLLVPVVLYLLLSPGVLFVLPGSGGLPAILVHAILFGLTFGILRKQFGSFY